MLSISCSNEDVELQIEETQISNFDLEFLENFDSAQSFKKISKNRLSNMLDINEVNPKGLTVSPQKIVNSIQKKELNVNEKLELLSELKVLGFDSIEMFNDYNIALFEFNTILLNETNFLDVPENKRNNILIEYFDSVPQSDTFIISERSSGPCEQAHTACKNLAQAVHTAGIVACTATSAGIAVGTFGIGGVIFQTFCLAANFDVFNAQLNVCNADFALCNQ